MPQTDFIDRLKIASPCPASWEQMLGDDRARHCELCNLQVYNIARMTRAEAAQLVSSSEGRICARLYRRSDGTLITRDCPVGLRAIRLRVAKATGAVLAAIVSLSSLAMGQKGSKKDSCTPQVKITRTAAPAAPESGIKGTIFDPNRAVIPGARVAVTDQKGAKLWEFTTKDDGGFQFSDLPAGSYDLQVQAQGFRKSAIKKLRVVPAELIKLDLILLLDKTTEVVGLLIDVESNSLIDNSLGNKTIIKGDLIRRLPIP
jgi:hypothetical protein